MKIELIDFIFLFDCHCACDSPLCYLLHTMCMLSLWHTAGLMVCCGLLVTVLLFLGGRLFY